MVFFTLPLRCVAFLGFPRDCARLRTVTDHVFALAIVARICQPPQREPIAAIVRPVSTVNPSASFDHGFSVNMKFSSVIFSNHFF